VNVTYPINGAATADDWDPDDYTDDVGSSPSSAPASSPRPPSPPQSSTLETRWIDLGNALEFVTEAPPPQQWLFVQWHGMRDHGVFPRGKTGLLTATGGVGKTYLLTQTAIAVASGGFLLETFRATEPGHVLLALGEEDAEEARRRIWRVMNASALTLGQREDIAGRIHLLPLHGIPIALTTSPAPGVIATSDFAVALRNKLNGHGIDWSLVILDPLSRWAAGGVEASNEAATRFVQIVETLTSVRGNPSVLVAHHSSQNSAQAGKSDARGVTGIRDGFRWQASMDAVEAEDGADGVILRNPKSNYSMKFRPVLLLRNTEPGVEGTLRLAAEHEAEALRALLPKERLSPAEREQAKTDKNRGAFESRRDQVLEALPEQPAHMSRDQLSGALLARGQSWSFETIRAVMASLISDGKAVDLSDGSRSSPRQWARA
jgi:RecA-family ATPase